MKNQNLDLDPNSEEMGSGFEKKYSFGSTTLLYSLHFVIAKKNFCNNNGKTPLMVFPDICSV
jgi:hypothetical protein